MGRHFRPIRPVLPAGPGPLRSESGHEAGPKRVQTVLRSAIARDSSFKTGSFESCAPTSSPASPGAFWLVIVLSRLSSSMKPPLNRPVVLRPARKPHLLSGYRRQDFSGARSEQWRQWLGADQRRRAGQGHAMTLIWNKRIAAHRCEILRTTDATTVRQSPWQSDPPPRACGRHR
jgi:hypothetical protein